MLTLLVTSFQSILYIRRLSETAGKYEVVHLLVRQFHLKTQKLAVDKLEEFLNLNVKKPSEVLPRSIQ